MRETGSRDRIYSSIELVVGIFFMAVAYKTIYDPLGMVTGGFSGVSIIVRKLTENTFISGGVPLWFTMLVLNVPLFVVASRIKDRKYVARTLFCAILLSVFLAILPMSSSNLLDYTLAAVYGGLFAGVGIGMVLRCDMTTGGTDMLAMVMHTKLKKISIVALMNFADMIIIICGALVFGVFVTLYSLIATFITALTASTVVKMPKYRHW